VRLRRRPPVFRRDGRRGEVRNQGPPAGHLHARGLARGPGLSRPGADGEGERAGRLREEIEMRRSTRTVLAAAGVLALAVFLLRRGPRAEEAPRPRGQPSVSVVPAPPPN